MEPSNRVVVTLLGLITLLLGGAYAALGGQLILGGAGWLVQPGGDPWVQVIALRGIVPAMIILLGIAFLVQGLLGLLAGSGVLLRKQWGRILTFILAILAILLGLVEKERIGQQSCIDICPRTYSEGRRSSRDGAMYLNSIGPASLYSAEVE